jgi:hypothetical protein
VQAALRAHRNHGAVLTADVTRPLADWAPALQARLQELR